MGVGRSVGGLDRRMIAVLLCVGLSSTLVLTFGTLPVKAAHEGKTRFNAVFEERVPVNFVFLGYDRRDVDEREFRGDLPRTYRPIIRSRDWYGLKDRFLGIAYTYDYDVVFTPDGYDDRFFEMLASSAKKAPLTYGQQQYNGQAKKVLSVARNHEIDATSVERWLALHPPAGVDTSEDTIFFINWYGRQDFRFHVYTKTGEKDPDTGVDFGTRYHEFMTLTAWGGTPPDDEETGFGTVSRVWFMDLSAGPDSWAENWQVDAEIDDYTIPPVWEYSLEGFRPPSALTGDLARIARYVGINLLFTPSPIYPPALTPPDLPDEVNLDMNTYEGQAAVDASGQLLKPKRVAEEVADLLPLTRVNVDHQDLAFESPGNVRCYSHYAATFQAAFRAGLWPLFLAPSCYPDRFPDYFVWSNLFLYNALHLDDSRDDRPGVDYEAMDYNYAVPDYLDPMLLGLADDNSINGTQSFVYVFTFPRARAAGFGLSGVMVHEYGHHFGMSHTHDGYDYERDLEYGPYGKYFFAWLGNESNSVMGYMFNNHDFSQFDRDNYNRFSAAGYANAAAELRTKIARSDRAPRAADELERAQQAFDEASAAFAGHRYLDAARLAKRSYELTVAGARDAGVKVVGNMEGTTPLPSRLPIPFPDLDYRTLSYFSEPVDRTSKLGELISRGTP